MVTILLMTYYVINNNNQISTTTTTTAQIHHRFTTHKIGAAIKNRIFYIHNFHKLGINPCAESSPNYQNGLCSTKRFNEVSTEKLSLLMMLSYSWWLLSAKKSSIWNISKRSVIIYYLKHPCLWFYCYGVFCFFF